ncbi:MAG TPA: hypothetical protein VII56_11900 [Rhizomicrobium sp.]
MTTSSSVFPPGPIARPSAISASAIIVATYRYVFVNAQLVLVALYLPITLAAIMLWILFKTYFSMLSAYLTSPDARMASLTLSATIAGYLIWLLLNVVASGRLARLIQGQPTRRWFDVKDMAPEARLYAAVLRFLLVLVLAAAFVTWVVWLVLPFLRGSQADYVTVLSGIGLAAFGIVFFVRCGFLIPALVMNESRGILRRGWQLSRRHFWPLAAVWVVVMVLPALLLQILGDFLTRPLSSNPAEPGMSPLAAGAHLLATDDIAIVGVVLTLTLSSALCLTLTTIGSCLVYRSLKECS